MRRLAVLLATGLGVGWLPFAPATWASLATALVFAALGFPLPVLPLAAALVIVAPLAAGVSGVAERSLGHDARPIVIDEVAGMMVGAFGAVGWHAGGPAVPLALLFLYFRLFDIAKPFPVNQLQNLPGGWGVVADDLAAGLYSAAALALSGRLLAALLSPALPGGHP
jgi:phosphatidylglycerophosphatase A